MRALSQNDVLVSMVSNTINSQWKEELQSLFAQTFAVIIKSFICELDLRSTVRIMTVDVDFGERL